MVVGVARSKVSAGNKFEIQADSWVSQSYEESPLIPAQPKSKPLFMEQFQEAHMHMAGGVPSGHSDRMLALSGALSYLVILRLAILSLSDQDILCSTQTLKLLCTNSLTVPVGVLATILISPHHQMVSSSNWFYLFQFLAGMKPSLCLKMGDRESQEEMKEVLTSVKQIEILSQFLFKENRVVFFFFFST